jgi:hypothetical protein
VFPDIGKDSIPGLAVPPLLAIIVGLAQNGAPISRWIWREGNYLKSYLDSRVDKVGSFPKPPFLAEIILARILNYDNSKHTLPIWHGV